MLSVIEQTQVFACPGPQNQWEHAEQVRPKSPGRIHQKAYPYCCLLPQVTQSARYTLPDIATSRCLTSANSASGHKALCCGSYNLEQGRLVVGEEWHVDVWQAGLELFSVASSAP